MKFKKGDTVKIKIVLHGGGLKAGYIGIIQNVYKENQDYAIYNENQTRLYYYRDDELEKEIN